MLVLLELENLLRRRRVSPFPLPDHSLRSCDLSSPPPPSPFSPCALVCRGRDEKVAVPAPAQPVNVEGGRGGGLEEEKKREEEGNEEEESGRAMRITLHGGKEEDKGEEGSRRGRCRCLFGSDWGGGRREDQAIELTLPVWPVRNEASPEYFLSGVRARAI